MLFFREAFSILKWRTRNILVDPFFILYWDLIPRLRPLKAGRYLEGHVPIPVTFLTYNRPHYFSKTIESFIEKNEQYLDRMHIYILIQGSYDQDHRDIINRYKGHIYKVLNIEENLGCAGGYNTVMSAAMEEHSEFLIHVQDDFVSNEPIGIYLDELVDLFKEHPELGCVRLRSINDRVNDYNLVSRRKIRYRRVSPNVNIGNSHFTLNPTLVRYDVVRSLLPIAYELEAMKKFQKIGLKGGQLEADCFVHIGDQRVPDWHR